MYLIVQGKHAKYKGLTEDAIFQELDKIILCQAKLDAPAGIVQRGEADDEVIVPAHPITGIPLVDIIANIDCFVTTHDDRDKIIRIVKELFNHCTSMKSLLKAHHKLILNNLVQKYDK